MSALIADPPKPQEEVPQLEQAPAPRVRTCRNCGAGLAPGQDWCLDCGSAVPGRLGGGTLRSSLVIVGVTLLLVVGAVAAAYAALSSSANRAARGPATVAQAPPVTTTAQPAAPVAPPTATTPSLPPTTPATPTPATKLPAIPHLPRTVTPTPTPVPVPHTVIPVPRATPHTVVPVPPATPHTVTPAPPATSSPTKLVLDANAASTYNPYNYPAQSFGDPARAIDGDNATAWTYTLDPTSAGKTAVGLVLDLKAPQKLRSVAVWTPSAGMTLELYGASGTLPLSIADPNWTHLATRRTLKAHERVPLKTQGRSFRYLLLWITHAPAGRATGTVGLSELSVFV